MSAGDDIGTVGSAAFGASGQKVLRRRPQCGHLRRRAGYEMPQFGQITVSGESEYLNDRTIFHI